MLLRPKLQQVQKMDQSITSGCLYREQKLKNWQMKTKPYGNALKKL